MRKVVRGGWRGLIEPSEPNIQAALDEVLSNLVRKSFGEVGEVLSSLASRTSRQAFDEVLSNLVRKSFGEVGEVLSSLASRTWKQVLTKFSIKKIFKEELYYGKNNWY